jgi:AcrR family transcriptional regulator
MESTPPPPRLRTRERQREDTRQRIYDAAMEIFRRDGFENARVDDVAKAAGVSHGTFYFHFATKDEVLIQCLRASEARVAEAIEAIAADAPLMVVLETAAAMIAREWEGDPQLFKDVGMVALRYLFRGTVAQMVTAGAATPASAGPQSLVGAVLTTRFEAAADRGELSRILPAHVLADLCLVNLFAATLAWCADPTARPLNLMLTGVLRIWLDGVRGNVV